MRRLLVAVLLSAMMTSALGAQGFEGARAGVTRSRAIEASPGTIVANTFSDTRADTLVGLPFAPRLRPYAPLISAAVPGGGQLLLGNGRFVVYAAVEAISWWKYRKDRSEVAQQTEAFKQIANGFARAPFSKNPKDGDWAYYEQMFDRLESGPYSES
ncbi:MAG TPA: hypothetical protein VK636_05325, partial [Gemmatimonadaceae bacterium]|nr:hypothetical protein [Gemmatimonadaceae bacterium]